MFIIYYWWPYDKTYEHIAVDTLMYMFTRQPTRCNDSVWLIPGTWTDWG